MLKEFLIHLNSNLGQELESPQFQYGNLAENALDLNLVSVINLEEDSSLFNLPNRIEHVEVVSQPRNHKVVKYVLMFSSRILPYEDGMETIHNLIEFFNNNAVIQLENINVRVEFFCPTIEELSQIWGMNGGNQYPAVFYKIQAQPLV